MRALKPIVATGAVLGCAALTAGCGALGLDDRGSGSGDDKSLVLAVETSPGDPLHDMLEAFSKEAEERLGDEWEIEMFIGGAMGDETAVVEALRVGEVDVAVLGSDISSLEPSFGILEFAFLFEDRETVTEFLDGEHGDLMSDKLVDAEGVKVLSYGENGFRNITNNTRPVEQPSDLDGLKLRLPEVPARVKIFKDLGAVPTTMSIDEVYLGLEQGVIDGQENPLNVIKAFSFIEQQKYLSLSGHTYSAASLTINAKLWDSLDDDVKEQLQEAADAAAETSRQAGEQADAELVGEFEEAGMQVNEIDKEAFREAVKPTWQQLRQDVGEDFAADVFDHLGVG